MDLPDLAKFFDTQRKTPKSKAFQIIKPASEGSFFANERRQELLELLDEIFDTQEICS